MTAIGNDSRDTFLASQCLDFMKDFIADTADAVERTVVDNSENSCLRGFVSKRLDLFTKSFTDAMDMVVALDNKVLPEMTIKNYCREYRERFLPTGDEAAIVDYLSSRSSDCEYSEYRETEQEDVVALRMHHSGLYCIHSKLVACFRRNHLLSA
jgi:hypothetical protein